MVFKDDKVSNSDCVMDFNALNDVRSYPIDNVNKFFASIRLVKGINTGYGQVFSLAKSWFNNTKANLPCVNGFITRAYPIILEDYYWNIESIPLITKSEIKDISRIFDYLLNTTSNSIKLSIKRFNQCFIRDSEEDSVLDVTIAFEALLSDNGNQEMTHKLAMRVGALARISNHFEVSPQQAFEDIKNIYKFRSAIVHGNKKLDKLRIIKLDDNKEVRTYTLAVEYLKSILKTLIDNPKYQDPVIIDFELLLGDKVSN